ncbi:polysaccharide deacetylase family protein [Aliikangiella coralliicola]|uniref:Polysaccharide deacetylase family protein n=1 Tax=Aliikangiella coralliicola TaxID=2592383 RepID=A0A545TZZ9_9GAMM|nr:polysaccharide deacetylase family protein [Aliikangiella coralliicola]TQV82789.1 polysaccharide deacetylase family protein [Aliikangiella coralliicola]
MRFLAGLTLMLILSFCRDTKATVVLQYHHISESTPRVTSTSPELFKRHMNYLKTHGFRVLAMAELIKLLNQKKTLPDKSVVITFDDGYLSIYENALPLLKQYDFPFTVFVNTKAVSENSKQFMSWRHLKELTRNKGTIANHSVSHAYLIRKGSGESESEWEKRVSQEISVAQAEIVSRLGKSVKAFAYPYGEFNLALKNILDSMGYIAFGQQSGAVSVDVDHQAIPRFPFGGSYGELKDFAVKVNSLPLPIASVTLLDEKDNRLIDHVLPSKVKRPKLVIKLKKSHLKKNSHNAELNNERPQDTKRRNADLKDQDMQNINLQCFSNGLAQGWLTQTNGELIYQSKVDLKYGRNRYNCTAKNRKNNRFFWFSQPWVRVAD